MEIFLANHKKLKRKISTYVKVDKEDKEGMELIYSFSRQYYHVSLDLWELPQDAFKIIVANYTKPINIKGSLPSDLEDFLSLLDIYDRKDEPYHSRTEPYEHQLDSYEYARKHPKFLLGDEQGLGKTKQAIDIAVSRKPKMHHCLIVCGVNGLKYNWEKEIKIHSNEKAHILGMNKKGKIGTVTDRYKDLLVPHSEFFLITNIETLRDKRIQKEIQKLCDEGTIGMTIIDEIHKAKNPTSEQGKAIHCCTSYYKLALTGTPLMNSAIDLYNILKWLEVENHTISAFKGYYCIMGGFGGYEIVGYQHLDELQAKLDSHMLRRKKDEVLDLPPKIKTNELLEMGKAQADIYKEVLTDTRNNIDKVMLSPNPLTALIRLRQATSNPTVLTTKAVNSIKFDRVVELVTDATSKVIVFSNWTQVINPLYEILKDKGFNPAIATGEIKDTQSQQDKFMNDKSCKVILGTIACLGTGFTLTAADTVIFVDEPWNMATKEQAEDRCHRIGTKGTVNIITLLCKGTIDERINQLIEDKGALSDAIVDNDKKQLVQFLLD